MEMRPEARDDQAKGLGAKNSRRGVTTQIDFNPSFLEYL